MLVGVAGIGLLAPGLEGWAAAREVLSGRRPFQPGADPDPEATLLPPNERRRSSDCVRWAVQAAQEAITQSGFNPKDVATVYASSGGEMAVLDRLCRSLATPERVLSPTLFHQSVHNTAAGYWGIATACQQSSTALSCYDDTFAAGLLEAATMVVTEDGPVLLVAYDLSPPDPLIAARPIRTSFAVALVLTPPGVSRRRTLMIELDSHSEQPLTTVPDPALEDMRWDNPAARSLPLLIALAQDGEGRVVMNLPDDQRLIVGVAHA